MVFFARILRRRRQPLADDASLDDLRQEIALRAKLEESRPVHPTYTPTYTPMEGAWQKIAVVRHDLGHRNAQLLEGGKQNTAKVLDGLDRVAANVRDQLQRWVPSSQPTSAQELRKCWPTRLTKDAGGWGGASLTGTSHDLVTSGDRFFGPRKLHVKLYDFALYFDAKQAKHSQLGKDSSRWLPTVQSEQMGIEQDGGNRSPTAPQQQPDFARALIGSPDIDMSLVVRASRKLPLGMMMAEYKGILKRRLQAVGGNPDDPALHEMLAAFTPERLPEGMVDGKRFVEKGSVLSFTKGSGGKVTAAADGKELITVSSPKFAAAVFDVYMGKTPVSDHARTIALDAAARMMASPEGYKPAAGLPGVCDNQPCDRQKLLPSPSFNTVAV